MLSFVQRVASHFQAARDFSTELRVLRQIVRQCAAANKLLQKAHRAKCQTTYLEGCRQIQDAIEELNSFQFEALQSQATELLQSTHNFRTEPECELPPSRNLSVFERVVLLLYVELQDFEQVAERVRQLRYRGSNRQFYTASELKRIVADVRIPADSEDWSLVREVWTLIENTPSKY